VADPTSATSYASLPQRLLSSRSELSVVGRFLAVVATPDMFGGCDGATGTGSAAAGREA
jgi:hypothetical protein